MSRLIRIVLLAIFLAGVFVQSSSAYDIPKRKIEIKPYFNIIFPHNLWERKDEHNIVEDKASLGYGLKIRSQISGPFGFSINASRVKFTTNNNTSGAGLNFTGGIYYSKPFEFGRFTFDAGYGIIIAAEEVLGLLLPSIEYAYPISERLSLAIELGWQIPNDWLKNFDFKESYRSYNITIGTNWLF